jgi:tRNA-Thr(GGU) m(6)t(6)A37 methyltransferase TsaA
MIKIQFQPIGIVHSPFKTLEQMPIQPTGAASREGYAEIFPEYQDGLKDLDGFSHIILLYHFHKAPRVDLTVTPFLDKQPRGVFATRAPIRPNHIGLSIVKLVRIEGGTIHLANIDILDGTPLLDIKPYVPQFDQLEDVRIGWLASAKEDVKEKRADERFK